MVKIIEYPSLEEALKKSLVKDIDHVLIRHSYPNGTKIMPHVHTDADEYVIISQGHFRICSENVTREFSLKGEAITVVYYPAGREHGLQVLGDKLNTSFLESQ